MIVRKYLIRYEALLCVIDSVDLHLGRTFSIALHILRQTKRQILQKNIMPTLHLLPKFQTSSSLLSLQSPVCVGPGREPRLSWKVDKY